MARGRNTPYPAQLKRLLNGDGMTVFSAATLEERFDHPPHQKRGTNLGRIHKALKKAFSEGDLITFVDEAGLPLRESEIVVPGSKAIGRPQLFGRPDTPSPHPGYHPVTYEETLRRGLSIDADEEGDEEVDVSDNCDRTDAEGDEGGADAAPEPEGDEPDAHDAPEMTVEEALDRLNSYPPEKAKAPDWVEDRLLRAWASLPGVAKLMIRGLDSTSGADKFELIRAGVTRKQRSWRSESTVAGNLANLCRTSPVVWANVSATAVVHYLRQPVPDGVAADDLPAIAANPLDYYDASDHPPEAVLLLAMALGAGDTVLEMIAADAASELGELKVVDKTTAQEDRIRTLEDEAVELRRTAKVAEKELKAATKRERTLAEEIEPLRSAQDEAGSAADAARAKADEQLLRRAEEAEANLEKLEGERIPELEARLEGLEDVSERLEAAEATLNEERRLRTQAEEDAKRHNARARELTDQMARAAGAGSLPTEDAAGLIDALGRPVGQAARHAAERLATGRARPHDDLLLELAATVAQMTGRLDADAAADAVSEAAEIAGAAVEPETDVAGSVVIDLTTEAAELEAPAPATNDGAPAVADEEAEEEPVETPSGETPTAPLLAGRRRRRSKLKVRPLGGAGEVGGSALLVTNSFGHAVMLDCGQRVRGEYGLDSEPNFHRRIGHDGRLHAILLSHAHIDHVGSLPVLHREQSQAQHEPIPVYMTAPTRQLAQIMLEDSAKIQQHRETNKADLGYLDYGGGTMEAAYRLADVRRVLDDEFVTEVSPGLAVPIPDTSFVARFLPVAHVLGSCAIHLTDTDNDQTLLYTGDLGPFGDPQATLPQYGLNEMLAADLVIMESTYGAQQAEFTDGRIRRALTPREAAVKRLCQQAEHAHGRGGCLLLPAFSLGRTQELAILIDQARRDGDAPAGEIVVAGMGEKITQVYETYSKGTNAWARAQDMPRVDELGGRLKRSDLTFDEVVGEVLEGGFSYVIASPAMLASGWSRTFLENMIDNPDHAIVMSGYVPRHAGGIPRLHQMHTGATMNISGRSLRIQAQFDQLKGLSAHAPSVDLRKFAEYMARHGKNVAFAMVHGDQAAQEALAEDVRALPEAASAESLHNGQVWQPTRT